jgi:hypothetical protein
MEICDTQIKPYRDNRFNQAADFVLSPLPKVYREWCASGTFLVGSSSAAVWLAPKLMAVACAAAADWLMMKCRIEVYCSCTLQKGRQASFWCQDNEKGLVNDNQEPLSESKWT